MSEKWGAKLGKIVGDLAKGVSDLKQSANESDDVSKVLHRIETTSARTKQFLDESGITERWSKTSDLVGEHVDTLAGYKQLALVQERLELQSQLNDLLAERLEEALDRIAVLESEVLEKRRGA